MYGAFYLVEKGVRLGRMFIDEPHDVFVYDAFPDAAKQPTIFALRIKETGDLHLSGDIVKIWLTARAPEPNYHFIDALLEKIGTKTYDPLAFVAYNEGRFITDAYYLACIPQEEGVESFGNN